MQLFSATIKYIYSYNTHSVARKIWENHAYIDQEQSIKISLF